MLQTDDPFERDDLAQDHSRLAVTFIQAREGLERLQTDENESELFEKLSVLLKQTQPLQTKAVQLAQEGLDRQAKKAFHSATQAQLVALGAIDRLLEEQEKKNEIRRQLAEQAYSDTAKYLLLIAAFILIAGGFISAYVWVKVGRSSQVLVTINQSLEETNKELAATMHRAESANVAKSEFLSNVSHELRTPMTSILGILGMLKDGVFGSQSESAKPMVDMAHRNSQRLLVLLNDLLDLSKIEAGKLDINPTKCDLRCELEDLAESFRQQATDKGLHLEYRLDNTIAKYVWVDSSRVYQILINLVGNAIKYTEKGGVLIDIQLKVTEDGAYIEFRVIDSGIGVSADQFISIFDKFVQGDGSASRKYGGTGLGLAISKQLVESMSGRIGVESLEPGGSVFWFTLPYHAREESFRDPAEKDIDSSHDKEAFQEHFTLH